MGRVTATGNDVCQRRRNVCNCRLPLSLASSAWAQTTSAVIGLHRTHATYSASSLGSSVKLGHSHLRLAWSEGRTISSVTFNSGMRICKWRHFESDNPVGWVVRGGNVVAEVNLDTGRGDFVPPPAPAVQGLQDFFHSIQANKTC